MYFKGNLFFRTNGFLNPNNHFAMTHPPTQIPTLFRFFNPWEIMDTRLAEITSGVCKLEVLCLIKPLDTTQAGEVFNVGFLALVGSYNVIYELESINYEWLMIP